MKSTVRTFYNQALRCTPALARHRALSPLHGFTNVPNFFFRPFEGFNDFTEEFRKLNEFRPSLDIKETEEGYTAQLDLPSMTKEDVEITLNEGVLTVDAKNTVDEKEAGKWHLRERNYSQQQITRSWSIPAGVTQEDIKARLDNGVLTISYPKPEEEPVKRISIE
ncbi:HSP20-like chaperone [Wallemia mellicola]|nr:HSP20-like chaperone [Wallemia mellicola]